MDIEKRANEVCYAVTGRDWGHFVESATLYRSLNPVVLAALREERERALEEAAIKLENEGPQYSDIGAKIVRALKTGGCEHKPTEKKCLKCGTILEVTTDWVEIDKPQPKRGCACSKLFEFHSSEGCWNGDKKILKTHPEAGKCKCADRWDIMGIEHGPRCPIVDSEKKLESGKCCNDNNATEGFCRKTEPVDKVEEDIRRIWTECAQDEGVKRIVEMIRLARETKGGGL